MEISSLFIKAEQIQGSDSDSGLIIGKLDSPMRLEKIHKYTRLPRAFFQYCTCFQETRSKLEFTKFEANIFPMGI